MRRHTLPYKSLPHSQTNHCQSLPYKSLPASHTNHCGWCCRGFIATQAREAIDDDVGRQLVQITATLPYKSLPHSQTSHCHTPRQITASLPYTSLPASRANHCGFYCCRSGLSARSLAIQVSSHTNHCHPPYNSLSHSPIYKILPLCIQITVVCAEELRLLREPSDEKRKGVERPADEGGGAGDEGDAQRADERARHVESGAGSALCRTNRCHALPCNSLPPSHMNRCDPPRTCKTDLWRNAEPAGPRGAGPRHRDRQDTVQKRRPRRGSRDRRSRDAEKEVLPRG